MINSFFNFTLTFMEVSGVLLLWSRFIDNKKGNIIRYIFLAFAISILNNIWVYSGIKYLFVINYSVIILLINISFRKRLENTIIEFFVIMVITMLLQLSLLVVINVLSDSLHLIYFSSMEIKGFVINILLLLSISIIRKFIKYDKVIQGSINMQLVYFYLISLVIYVLIIKCVWEADYRIIVDNIVVFIGILAIYMIVNFKFLKALITLIEEKKNLEAFNRYSKLSIDLFNDVKSKQHDFKNHLSTIYGIVQVSSEKDCRSKIKEYIEGLNNSFSNDQNVISLENKVLAGIIFSKIQRSEEMNIDFTYSINSDTNLMPVKDYELAEILFNLLDNAFEAVHKLEKNRWVKLIIDKEKENSIIHIKNSGATLKNTNINEIFKKGFSTKGSQRGFGLYNIKSIVDKYGGSIEITTQNDSTEFILLFH